MNGNEAYKLQKQELKKDLPRLFEYVRLQKFLEKEDDLVTTIMKAVERLHPRERQLITLRYLEQDYVRDFAVYQSMGISKDTFIRIRSAALFKLSMALNVRELNKQAAERVRNIAN